MARWPGEDLLADRLHRWATVGALHGGVLAVACGDGPARTIPFGQVQGPDGWQRAQADHRFLLTSITKALTALQVLRLVDTTDLSLTTPLAEVVPAFGRHGKRTIEIRHALTHTSGIDDRQCNTAEGPPRGLTPAEHLAAVCAASSAAPPGTRVAYCSPVFWVLAELIAKMTGMSHVAHLDACLTGPLDMAGTRYEPGSDRPDRYIDAVVGQPRHHHLPEQVRRLAYPAGGVVSTAGDLLRLGRWLLRGGKLMEGTSLLSQALLADMWRPWTIGLPGARDYEGGRDRTERGLGWALGGPGQVRSPRTLWHSGGSGTSLWVDPDHQAVVVLLTATWFLPRDLLGQVVDAALTAVPVSASPRRR